ncbi:hypothetical protein HK096_004331, partial [Nowakowskiella sp. JEL0078]
AKGYAPLTFAIPRFGPNCKFILINFVESFDSLFDLNLFRAVWIAYPKLFEVHHIIKTVEFNSQNNRIKIKIPPNLCGVVHFGKLSESVFAKISTGRFIKPNQDQRVLFQPDTEEVIIGSVGKIRHSNILSVNPTLGADAIKISSPVHEDNSSPINGTRSAIVCGPGRFQAEMVDWLSSYGEFEGSQIKILEGDSEKHKSALFTSK